MAATDENARGFAIVAEGSANERRVPIFDRLVIGRECNGVAEMRRLIIDDPAISRRHVEVRLERDGNAAHAVDVSANGTRLNGTRMERGVLVPLHSGDRLQIGDQELRFEARAFASAGEAPEFKTTARRMSSGPTAMVVGDIVGYSLIAAANDSRTLTETLETVFSELRELLRSHGGMLANYAGDAFFGAWELRSGPDGVSARSRS